MSHDTTIGWQGFTRIAGPVAVDMDRLDRQAFTVGREVVLFGRGRSQSCLCGCDLFLVIGPEQVRCVECRMGFAF
ncbi:hypothetical protein [Tessaracoccus caeni]|uniref:hypothetical protein n=1 Tax=Tessaracoccus caeni TaxID=3031239 RepID=UPI0023DBF81B|nr:hypothetical protein [Tessaracoccus caeni]MDF1487362.1 hypothetical protein [Tessaracoccus caeni]